MSDTDRHPAADELQRFLTGALPGPELEQVAAHLDSCPQCQAALPVALPDDPLLTALRRPLEPEPCTLEPECGSTLDQLTAEAPSTVSMAVPSETASFPRLPSDRTPHLPAALAPGPVPTFTELPCEFGRYRILSRLGQGGMGAVFLAEDTLLQRRVALKVSRLGDDNDAEAEERFRREARAAAALQHEGICPVYDYGIHAGVPFITMALIEGKSLHQVLKESKTLEPRRAAALVRQIALALAEAHRRGVLHRDLTPANILIDEQGRPKVVDFGLARRAEDVTLTRPGATAGTPAYMSPEQVQGEPLSAATDLYSLGVILFQLLTGKLPFPGSSLSELSYQIVHRPAQRPSAVRPDIDPRLDAICQKALAKNPGERQAGMSELAAELQAYLDGVPVKAPVVRPTRLRWWHGAAVAAVLLLAVGLAVAFWPRDAEEPEVASAKKGTTGVVDSNPKPAAGTSGKERPGGAAGKRTVDLLGHLSGTIDVRVWDRKDPERNGVLVKYADNALPLQRGDRVSIEAKMTHPAYLYVVWIDAKGSVLPIYPGEAGKWDRQPEMETRVDSLNLPQDRGPWPIAAGPAGMETLLLLARAEPLPADCNLKTLIGKLPKQPRPDRRSAVCFENFRPIRSGNRGPSFFDTEADDNPVLETQRVLQQRLQKYFPYSTAVSFANLGGG
jgi:predicted Ser/Thr protein kinase